MSADLTIPGPVVFMAVLYAGMLTVAACAVLAAASYAIFTWADRKWGARS